MPADGLPTRGRLDPGDRVVPGDRVDLGDLALLPGLVDTHVHVNDPGRTDWEGFGTASAAALAGGITAIVDMPLNSDPVTTDIAALEAKRARAARDCRIHTEFWGGLVPGNLDQLTPLAEAGVRGFKCFTVDSGIADFPPVDASTLERAAPTLARLDLPLLVHAEDPRRIRPTPHPDATDLRRSYAEYLSSRPAEAEVEAVRMMVELARRHGVRVHVVHVSSAGALEALREAGRTLAGRVSAETCPHYLSFAAADIPDAAPVFKCAPPIRAASDRDALWEGLIDGTLQLIASDHSPCPPDLKRVESGDLFAAWGGISSLELGLSAVWTAAAGRGVTLERVAGWMSGGPAELAGLERRGRIAPGYVADLVAFDPESEWVVSGDRPTRHSPTPYLGMSMRGRVVRTWTAGRSAYSLDSGAKA